MCLEWLNRIECSRYIPDTTASKVHFSSAVPNNWNFPPNENSCGSVQDRKSKNEDFLQKGDELVKLDGLPGLVLASKKKMVDLSGIENPLSHAHTCTIHESQK